MNITKILEDFHFWEDYLKYLYHYESVKIDEIIIDNKIKYSVYFNFIYTNDNYIYTYPSKRIFSFDNLERYILSKRREKIERIKSLIK